MVPSRSRIRSVKSDSTGSVEINGDGRLHAREISAAPDLLTRLDRNQDGALRSHEIPGSMVVGFVRGNPQQDDALLVMPAETIYQQGAVPRWFARMDTNRDGEIGLLKSGHGQSDPVRILGRLFDIVGRVSLVAGLGGIFHQPFRL